MPKAERTGYTFGGWYENDGLTGNAETQVAHGSTGNKTFYAKWTVNGYTVTLVTNGGTIAEGNVTGYTYGQGATLPTAVSREGHTFGGWYVNSDFSGDAVTKISETETGNKTFYAKWTINSYTLIFDENNGDEADVDNNITANYGDAITIPQVTRSGYTFAGWFEDAEGDGNEFTYTTMPDLGANGLSKTLYAKWNINTYTLKFDENGASAVNNDITGQFGKEITLPTVSREGYTFEGWYENAQGTGSKFEATTMPALGANGSSKTFYAKWSTIKYTITFVENEGNEVADIPYTIESDTITLPKAERTGYTFAGWFEDDQFNGSEVTQVAHGSTGDKTFYAKWGVDGYTITFETNGGSGVA